MKTTKILANIILAAGMMVAFTACEDEVAATYQKLNGKWMVESAHRTVSLDGEKIFEEDAPAEATVGSYMYFMTDTTGAMQDIHYTRMQEFTYEYKPETQSLILNIKYNGYRRAVIRGYGYGYSQMADFKFIDDNTFSIAYSYYEYCDEYDLRNQYDYELSEDQINEYDEYYVKVDFEGTYKRVTE